MRVRPTSMDNVTGTSRITSRFTSDALRLGPGSTGACALARSRSSRSSSSANCAAWAASCCSLVMLMASNLRVQDVQHPRTNTGNAFFDLHGLLAVGNTERTFEDGHVLGEDGGAACEIARQNVARFHVHQLAHGDLGAAEHRR